MNVFFKRLLSAALVLTAAVALVACDEDSDSGKSNRKSRIVGHWYEVYSEDGEVCYDIETYNADGTFEEISVYPDGVYVYASGTYIYDHGELTKTVLAGEKPGVHSPHTVTIKDEMMYVDEGDGDTYVLQRMSDEMFNSLVGGEGPDAPSASITGYWCREDVDGGEPYTDVLTFLSSGRFEEVLIYGGTSERLRGRYERSGSKLSMDYDDGETVTATAEVSASTLVLRLGSEVVTFRRITGAEYDRLLGQLLPVA